MPRFSRRWFTCCWSLLLLTPLVAAAHLRAGEWTRFRGPNGSGLSDATTVPVQWSEEDYNWRIALPGKGHSSPVIWKDRLFVTSADLDAGARYLMCIDTADGTIAWQESFPLQKHAKHNQNTFATNSPTVDERHVYVVWQSPTNSTLNAFDHAGKPIWKQDLGAFKAGHGSAVSPIVHDGKVVLCNDHQGADPCIIAVEGDTGAVAWKYDRKSMRPCYSTPCIFQPADRPAELIFTHSYLGITSLDPQTGDLNWETFPFGEFTQRACASPVVAGDLVIGTSGFATAEKNVVAMKPSYDADGVNVQEIYRISKSAPHVPTPLVYRDLMFLWTDRGIVTCVGVADGEMVWQKRVGGNYFGSPICVNGRLYCMSTDGEVVVLAAAVEYELLARVPLNETTCATPAVADGTMYLRTMSHLMSVGGAR